MSTDHTAWQPLAEVFVLMIESNADDWVITTTSDTWDDGPYVQLGYEGDMILAEMTSNRFLRPIMHEDDETLLRDIGWNEPEGDKLPNWFIWLPNSPESARQIADMWIRGLREAYQLPDDMSISMESDNRTFNRICPRLLFSGRYPGFFKIFNYEGLTMAEVEEIDAEARARKLEFDTELIEADPALLAELAVLEAARDQFLREMWGD